MRLRCFSLAILLWCGAASAAGIDDTSSDALFSAALINLNDQSGSLKKFVGKPLIVNFWARWCTPCRSEIPELISLRTKYHSRGIEVIGIALDDKAESVRDFVKAYEMNYPVLMASNNGLELMQALGNSKKGLPFTLAIDRQGHIVQRKLGAISGIELTAAAELLLR